MTVTLVALLVVFVLTQLPLASYAIYRLYLTPGGVSVCGSALRFLSTTADTLTVLNSAVNFLIYYPSASTFRKSLSSLWNSSTTSSFVRSTLWIRSRSTSLGSSLHRFHISSTRKREVLDVRRPV